MAQSAYNGSLGGEISRGEWVDRVFCHSLLRSLHLACLQVGTTHHLCSSTQLSSSNTVHSIGHESYEVQFSVNQTGQESGAANNFIIFLE